MEKHHNIKVPHELFEAIRGEAKELGFGNVEEYIIHRLRQSLKIAGSIDLKPQEEQKIKERLRSLGYLE